MTSCSIVANLVSSDPMKSDLILILKYTILGNVHIMYIDSKHFKAVE